MVDWVRAKAAEQPCIIPHAEKRGRSENNRFGQRLKPGEVSAHACNLGAALISQNPTTPPNLAVIACDVLEDETRHFARAMPRVRELSEDSTLMSAMNHDFNVRLIEAPRTYVLLNATTLM